VRAPAVARNIAEPAVNDHGTVVDGDRTISARYVFPAWSRAAVYATTRGSTDVTQPLALPAGVEDTAIGGDTSMEVGAEPQFA